MQTEAERPTGGGSSFGVAKVLPTQQANQRRRLTADPLNPAERADLNPAPTPIGNDSSTFG